MSSTKSNPLLTIIMPTYNAGSTIEFAIKSIIHQAFQNIEVLIIDGLSNDDTIEIAKKYQLEFPQIKIISEADKGIYDAMNKGIRMASGEWIYFLGSDDSLYDTHTLQRVSLFIKEKRADVIYGNVYSDLFKGIYDGEFSYSKLTKRNICHQSIFYKRQIFSRIGMFNTRYKALADWDHNIRWFYSSEIKIFYINEVIANYSAGGFSSQYFDEDFKKNRNLLLLKAGINKIPKANLIQICKKLIRQAKADKSFLFVIFLTLLKFYFQFILRLQEKFNMQNTVN